MGTLRLTLLRHGQAEPGDSAPKDFERALTERGTLEARTMGARLARRSWVPDLILASPAKRTWTTASLVAAACEFDGKRIESARDLYLATPEIIWQLLQRRAAPAAHILICGHNPGLSQLAGHFGPKPRTRELTTAGLASALWTNAEWSSLQPGSAAAVDLDDPSASAQD